MRLFIPRNKVENILGGGWIIQFFPFLQASLVSKIFVFVFIKISKGRLCAPVEIVTMRHLFL